VCQVDSIGGPRPTENLSSDGTICAITSADQIATSNDIFLYAWMSVFGALRHLNEQSSCCLAASNQRCHILLIPSYLNVDRFPVVDSMSSGFHIVMCASSKGTASEFLKMTPSYVVFFMQDKSLTVQMKAWVILIK
jgi:hypothetical protein